MRIGAAVLFLIALLTISASAAVSPRSMRAHMKFLASDLLEGREAGTRGFDVAAEYVVAQFMAVGLEPAGDGGSWLQKVEARTAMIDPAGCSITVDGRPLVLQKDVIFRPDFVRTSSDADGEIVFAGFGISAPELGHDDYAGIDVKGKIVLMLSGAPPRFPSTQRAFYSDRSRKIALAGKRGAIGILATNTRLDERRSPFAKAAEQAGMRSMRAVRGTALLDVTPEIRANLALSTPAAASLFARAPVPWERVLDDAAKSQSHSFPLGVNAVIRTTSVHGSATSHNVVGRIAGAAIPSEHVAITAHLDHLGMATKGEDRFYNGMLDNASGVAALIEIAREIASAPGRPLRSIVFAALTGEEKGGTGAAIFNEDPPVSSIVANVNMDMFTMLFPVADVVALGGEHSTLGPLAVAAAASAGFTTSPDPQPEEVRFIRSDQYAFVEHGIPAMTFKQGLKSRDAAVDGATVTGKWLREIYHTVHDNPDQKLDYESGARWADANRNLVLAIANARDRPRWNKGDFFGKTFSRP